MRIKLTGLLSICIVFMCVIGADGADMTELSGTVTGPDGKPVDQAECDLYLLTVDQASMSYEIRPLGQTASNADGKFAFSTDPKAVKGYAIYSCLAQKEGLSCGWDTVVGSNQGVFNITLTEPQKMTGFVYTADGKPVQDAEVRLLVMALPGGEERVMFGIEPVEAFVTKTCSEGRFDFENLPQEASVEFLVRKPGMGTLHTFNTSMDPSDGLTYRPGQEDIRLTLQEGFKIIGKVISQEDGKPVGNIPVVAVDTQLPVNLICKPVQTLSDGSFGFTDLAPGDYRVSVQDDNWIVKPLTVSIRTADVEDAVLELGKGGLLEVTVVDSATEEPISGAQVQLNNEEDNIHQGATSDASGIARKQLPAGTYRVSAYGQGYQYLNDGGTVVVENNKTATLTVQLGGQAKISGKVFGPDGKPAAGADVRIVPGSGGRENVTTDENGTFKLAWDPEQMSWAEGEFYLIASATDKNLAGVELIGNDTQQVTITLQKGATVKGKVLNEKQEPIAGARVFLYFRGSRFSTTFGREIKTDSEGFYTFNSLSPEYHYSVNVSNAEGYGTGRQEIEPGPDAFSIEVKDIILPTANLKLSGQVVDVDDKPAANVNLHCYGEGQPNLNARTGSDGKFSFDHVCAGEIRINASLNVGGEYMYANVRTEGGAEDVKVVLTSQGGSQYVPKQAPSLVGKTLPELSGFGITVPGNAKAILLFAWDMNQRPSRHFVKQLAVQAEMLKEKNIGVILLNTAPVEKETLDTWLRENGIDYPCGIMSEDAEGMKFKMGVRSLPWLILTDGDYRVIAEGFSIDVLEEKLGF